MDKQAAGPEKKREKVSNLKIHTDRETEDKQDN